MRRLVMMAVLAAAAAGCGGDKKSGKKASGGGSASPEAAFKDFINALGAGDGEAAVSYFPSEALMAETVDCSGDGGEMLKELKEAREGTLKDAKEIKEEGASLEFVSATAEGSEQVMKAGESAGGCKLKRDVTIKNFEIKFMTKKGDDKKERSKNKPAVKIGDGWYLIED